MTVAPPVPSTPERRDVRVGAFLTVGTILSVPLIALIAGGMCCPAVVWGLALSGVGYGVARCVRQSRRAAWTAGLAVTLTLVVLTAWIVRWRTPESVFEAVFLASPPPGVELTRSEQTFVFLDPAALVVVDNLELQQMRSLAAAAGLERQEQTEEELKAPAHPEWGIPYLVPGTDFFEGIEPTPDLEYYERGLGGPKSYHVLYLPTRRRAYAYWLDY